MTTSRKVPTRGLALLLSAGLALTVAPATLSAAVQPQASPAHVRALATDQSEFGKFLESKYVDPDRIYSADVRWWLGDASHTDETLLEQIQALYDGGFRGVELCMQNDTAAPDALYAYGSEMWTHKWNLMMNKLLDLGMSVYLTSGTHWATSNVPGLDPDSQAAMQNLTLGTATVDPAASLTVLPAPAANARRTGAKFVTAYAYRVVSGDAVEPASFVNLAPLVSQGADVWTQNLNWAVPADGTYRVFAIWTQGTYQSSSPAAQTSYATNYFDVRGVAALREFWEAHYLSDPALKAKIAKGDVQLFMDSLEITPGTAGITWWAEDMAAEFQKRKGYDIMPHIFLLYGLPQVNAVYNAYIDRAKGTYDLAQNANLREKIINDYLDVLTDLYRERMLEPLKEWLNSVGIETRAQISYGRSFEISEPIMSVDYPEAENFNQYDQVDIFRLWTGGAKLTNKVLSSESGAQLPQYTTRQLQLKDFYSQYAAGFQRMIWHVWAADYGYGDFAWPGFTRNFFHPGTRHPGARDYDEYNAHIGRVQQLMQTGKSRTDVGFIHNNWNQGIAYRAELHPNNPEITQMNWQQAHMGVYYRSTELQDNGYTYDYFSPEFLFADDVSFNTSTKTIEPAGYKAVVLYQDWLDVKGAKKLLDWAKKGLKVVILDDAGSRTPFKDGKDALLKKIMDELKTLSTVRKATVYDDIDYFGPVAGGYEDNVMEKLQDLGVYPYTGYAEENHQLLTQTRQDEQGNRYLYVYNYCANDYHHRSYKSSVKTEDHGTNIKTDVEVQGKFVPYFIDAWSGKVTELADYRWENGRTIVPIDLDYNNIALLAFEKASDEELHVVSTNADSALAVADGVAVRATESGSVTTKLSDGKQYQKDVTVPASYDITDWDLIVQSWTPNNTERNLVRTEKIGDLTTVNTKTSTVKTPISVELDKLKTWNNIPEVGRNVSGTGHYEATFGWDASKASGAYLDFGDKLEESMEVWINGRKVGGEVSTHPTKVKKDVGGVGKPTIDDGTGNQVPLVGKDLYTGGISLTNPLVDISDYLVDGENKIAIEYSSTLMNVQLSRGVITEMKPISSPRSMWWGNDQVYLDFGPAQAKVVPFVELQYPEPKLTNTAAPTISGVAEVGATLTVSNGTWSAEPSGFSYQWLRGDQVIQGATASEYLLTADDLDRRISVRVTATLAGYESTSVVSAPVGPVVKSKLSNSVLPVVSGTAKVGSTLSVSEGAWSPKPDKLSYQWLRNGLVLGGAVNRQYKVTAADLGAWISVAVTASAPGSESLTAITEAVGPVVKGSIVNRVAPVISGKAKVGSRLYASKGVWSPTPSKYGYQWYRNGKAIKKATSSSYKLTNSDKGKKITVKVTAKLTGFNDAARTSKAVGPIKRK